MTDPRPPAVDLQDPHDDPRVVRALEDYLADLEAGRTPDRDVLLAAYADVAGPLAECLDGLDFLRDAGGQAADSSPTAPAGTDQLGDFRLIREIGRGGMGVVYEAEQVSLGRRVALKVLPAAVGSRPADLRRFRHEARAAALLSHPHIVPVYTVGSDRGVHYIAMRLVPGPSLAELLARPSADATLPYLGPADPTHETGDDEPAASSTERLPSLPDCPRFAARLALQAADALAHAHAAGIVHRDVKPGNLILDGRGHLWVTDFGLAFLPGASRVTRSGAMVGTLRYMAPEQVDPGRGETGPRTDLYGLGATLYEVLTRAPVVDGEEHWAVVGQILNRAPVPPRRLNPRIPVDLETIVLTLLAKDPADRYPSAAELADDLRRFLDSKAIRARRPCLSERFFRWVGRHRRAAAAAVGVVLAVVALKSVNEYRLARERDRTRDERQQARAAVDDLYIHFAEQWLAHEPGMEPRQREFLVKAQAYYDRLARADGSGRDDRLAAAAALRRVADIDARLGRPDDAEAAYAEAADRLRRLSGEFPGWSEATREAAVCATDRGNLFRSRDRFDDAGREYRAAAEWFRSLVDGGSDDPFDRAGLAGVENNQGLLWGQLARPAEAEACFRAARAKFARLAAEFPDRPAFVSETAGCCHNLADLLAEAGRDDEADRAYREALVLRERAAELAPGVPTYRRELARTRAALAAALLRRGQTDEAGGLAAAALTERQRLAADFPASPAYRFHLACGLRTSAECLAAAGQTTDALRHCDRAADLLRPLADGSGLPAASELARVRHAAGLLLAGAGRPDDARAALRDAVAVADRLSGRTPFDRQTRTLCHLSLARFLRSHGEPGEAGQLVRAVAPGDPPPGASDRIMWAAARCELAESARWAGRWDEASAVFRSALDQLPGNAVALAGLARVAADTGQFRDAARRQAEVVAALDGSPGPVARRARMANELVVLAEFRRAAGDPAGAGDDLRRAERTLQGVDDRAAGTAEVQAALARVEFAWVGIYLDRGDLSAAEAAARRSADRFAAGAEPTGAAETLSGWADSLRRREAIHAAQGRVGDATTARAERTRVLERLTASAPTAEYCRELALALVHPPVALPGDPERAVTLARRAVEQAGDDWRNHAALGVALTADGRAAEAAGALARAAALRPAALARAGDDPNRGWDRRSGPDTWRRQLTAEADRSPPGHGGP